MSAVTRNEAGFVLSHASSCLIPGRTHIWTVITNNCTQFLKHSSNFFSSFSKNQIQPFHMDIVDSFFSQDQKVCLGNGKKVWVHFHSRAHLSQVLPGGWWARLESFTSLSSGHIQTVMDSAKILQLKFDEFGGMWIISQFKKTNMPVMCRGGAFKICNIVTYNLVLIMTNTY